MSDTFINDKKFGVGTKLGATNPIMKKLKIHHPEIYDEVFGKTFDKSTLTEIREGIASKVAIGDTGLFGYEAANILHEESSAMTKKAQDVASDAGFNMIHDVTMGSAKPINLVDDLVNLKNYEPAEVMFIMYTEKQARATVVDRYIRGNFTNLNTTGGRGGRYVMSSVIDSSTKKVKTKAGFKNKTQDLLGRDAVTDNEVFLNELLQSDNVSTDLDDIQIINRTYIDPATGQAKAYRIELELKDGKIVAKRSSRGVDGLKVVTKEAESKFGGNRAGLDDLEEILEEQQLKSSQGNVTIGVSQSYLDEIEKRKNYFKNLKRKYDDAGLYIVAKQKGYTGKPKVVKKATDLFEGDGLRNAPKDITIKNGRLQEDVVVFRGLSDSMDTDQDTWTLQSTKIPAATRVNNVTKQLDLSIDDRIPSEMTDLGITFYKAEEATNRIKRHVNDLNVVAVKSDYIDAESFKEAQEQFRLIKLKEIENGAEEFFTESYFTTSDELVKQGYVDIGLLNNKEFQIIYDEVLYSKGVNVLEKPMPPLVMTGQQMHDEFINGDYYAGHGIYGRGTYTDTNLEVAEMYANQSERVDGFGEGGVVQAIKLEKGTKMPSQETVSEVARQVEEKRMEYYNRYQKGKLDEYKTQTYRELSQTTELDVGRTLAAMGYQAYDVSMLDSIKSHVVILDRSAVTVAETPIMINGEYTK